MDHAFPKWRASVDFWFPNIRKMLHTASRDSGLTAYVPNGLLWYLTCTVLEYGSHTPAVCSAGLGYATSMIAIDGPVKRSNST